MRRYLIEGPHGYQHVRTWGSAESAKRPLLLLHMAPLSGQMFERVAPLLATDRLVVAPDRIGYGQSDPYTDPPTVPEYANATLHSLDEIGVGQFNIFGLHSGAAESIELATAHAERVLKVGLSGILGFPSPDEARQWVRETVSRGFAPEITEDGAHMKWRWDRRMRWNSHVPPQDLAWAQRNLLDELLASPHDNMTTIYAYPWIDNMAKITQPLLIIIAHDYLVEPTTRAVLSAPPGTTVVDVPLEPDGVAAPTGLYSASPDVMAGHFRDFFD